MTKTRHNPTKATIVIYKTQTLSAYLVQPTTNSRLSPIWRRLTNFAGDTYRSNPHLIGRTLIALSIWCAGVSAYQGFAGLTGAKANSTWTLPTGTGLASSGAAPATVAPRVLTAAVHAAVLPSGPSGLLLPPGTMAPDRTYTNSYARGQCTWYVAGRRQIPPKWGNANTWYSHAIANKWSVGTVPAIAAVAWTSAGYFGHVALVEQIAPDGKSVYVSEMNYRGLGIKSFRWAPTSEFKYIY